MGARYKKHDTLKKKLRHSVRFPQLRQPTARFTYSTETVDGQKGIVFWNDRRPMFKRLIGCSREDALALVRRLNACTDLPKYADQIIDTWWKTVVEKAKAAAEIEQEKSCTPEAETCSAQMQG